MSRICRPLELVNNISITVKLASTVNKLNNKCQSEINEETIQTTNRTFQSRYYSNAVVPLWLSCQHYVNNNEMKDLKSNHFYIPIGQAKPTTWKTFDPTSTETCATWQQGFPVSVCTHGCFGWSPGSLWEWGTTNTCSGSSSHSLGS